MFDTIRNEGRTQKREKMKKKLSVIQKIKLRLLEENICIAMKNGNHSLLVDFYIDERLIQELRNNGFQVELRTFGCAALYTIAFVISW